MWERDTSATGARRTRIRLFAILAASSILFAGCSDRPPVKAGDPQMDAFVEVMMPRSIEIQRYLTRPVDFSGSGEADGIEVVLSAEDADQDPVKCVGAFQFELYTQRKASGDPLGTRLAHWPVDLNSTQQMKKNWDRVSRFYRFPLEFDGKLPAGEYILTASLRTPTGESLFDQYGFTHDGSRIRRAP
jgi:hypothetical protein